MTYASAVQLLNDQHTTLKGLSKIRLFDYRSKTEYRLTYRGGFSSYLAIDARYIGGHAFHYFGGVSLYDCLSARRGLIKAIDKIFEKNPWAQITVPGEITYLEAPSASGQNKTTVL